MCLCAIYSPVNITFHVCHIRQWLHFLVVLVHLDLVLFRFWWLPACSFWFAIKSMIYNSLVIIIKWYYLESVLKLKYDLSGVLVNMKCHNIWSINTYIHLNEITNTSKSSSTATLNVCSIILEKTSPQQSQCWSPHNV